MIQKDRFGEEVNEYLGLKGKATRTVYSSAFNLFLKFYRNKHGEGKGFGDYLDRIYEELKKSRREQRRIAEIELFDFINFLKDLDKSQAEEARKISFEQWLKLAHEHYDEFWYTTESGKRRISTEKICLLLGCSQTMAQRIRQTLNQMTREEVLEFIRKRLGII